MALPRMLPPCRHQGHRLGTPLSAGRRVLAGATAGIVVVCGVAVAGCASPSTQIPGSATTAAASVTRPPVSPAEYERELQALGETLGAAFDGVATASAFEPLAGQLDSAAATVRTGAQQLTAITPPPSYRGAHPELLSGLDQLATELAGLSAQVRSRELCASQPVMATLSTSPGSDALRRTAETLGPPGAGLAAALAVREPLQDRRLANGSVLRDPGSGYGEIEVQNGTDRDAVVTLSQAGQAVGSFSIARGETAQLTGIPDGVYEIFFTSGVDWDGAAFTRSCGFERFEDTATFATTEVSDGIEYTTLSVTLHPVAYGTAPIVTVPPESFPR